MSTIAIVGAGLAGAKAAEALREEGYAGEIVLIGAEPHRPYERPALSKDYLSGSADRDSIDVQPEQWYAEHNVDLRLTTAVTAVDAAQHKIELADGSSIGYDKLLLTTGSSPRHLTVPGADLAGVHYLRTVDDSESLKAAFGPGVQVVVIGAGWIGLESAAAAKKAGSEVTVLEYAELPLLRVLGPTIAKVFAELHRANGVALQLGVSVDHLQAGSDGTSVHSVVLQDGTEISADVVVVGIGVQPNVALAQSAGLEVDNGVLVDEHLQTSDPDIYAAGDVANAFHRVLDRRIRVEHWANALNQPETAARSMLGTEASYDKLPYFYTDQFDLGMEYVGYAEPDGYDEVVVRGDLASREFIAFWLKDRRVLAGMNVNIWDVSDQIAAIITSGVQVDLVDLGNPDVPLESFAPTTDT